MTEYYFSRKTIPSSQMLWLIIKSWFTAPPLSLGCLFFVLFMPTYFLALLFQILLFLPVLPVIILAYLPLSLGLYRGQERNWLFWTISYALCATLLSIIPIVLFIEIKGLPFLLGAFIFLSGLCGMSAYFNLYNVQNIENRIEATHD